MLFRNNSSRLARALRTGQAGGLDRRVDTRGVEETFMMMRKLCQEIFKSGNAGSIPK